MQGDNFRAVRSGPSAADLWAVLAEIDRAKANPYPPGGAPDIADRQLFAPTVPRPFSASVRVVKQCGRCGLMFQKFYIDQAAANTANGLKYCDGCTKS